jgi:defect in organelle trafficking protein DotC
MQKLNLIKLIISLTLIISISGCGWNKQTGNTDSLAGLKAMSTTKRATNISKKQMGRIREEALKETALSLGAQSGLAHRADEIDDNLLKQARNLDKIYNFTALMLEHNIQPPVLLEGRHTLNLADNQSIRISDRTYKVAKQARFVTTAPNWRQYLWMDYKKPERPHITMLPKTKRERRVWKKYVTQGWNNGMTQADTILAENIARIKEDFVGMVLYRKLLAMNMISPPYVAHTNLGVTGDNNEIHIDDKVLRITALPGLNINSKQWRAAISKDEDKLKRLKAMEKLASNSDIVVTSKAWQPVIAPIN